MRAAFSAGGEEGAVTAATPPPPELPPLFRSAGVRAPFPDFSGRIVAASAIGRSSGISCQLVTQLVEGARPIRGGSVIVEGLYEGGCGSQNSVGRPCRPRRCGPSASLFAPAHSPFPLEATRARGRESNDYVSLTSSSRSAMQVSAQGSATSIRRPRSSETSRPTGEAPQQGPRCVAGALRSPPGAVHKYDLAANHDLAANRTDSPHDRVCAPHAPNLGEAVCEAVGEMCPHPATAT